MEHHRYMYSEGCSGLVPGVSHIMKCDWLVKNMTDWWLEIDLGQLNDCLTATCREYDWRRRLCISFVVCYCVSYAVHDIVSGPTAPITCSDTLFRARAYIYVLFINSLQM